MYNQIFTQYFMNWCRVRLSSMKKEVVMSELYRYVTMCSGTLLNLSLPTGVALLHWIELFVQVMMQDCKLLYFFQVMFEMVYNGLLKCFFFAYCIICLHLQTEGNTGYVFVFYANNGISQCRLVYMKYMQCTAVNKVIWLKSYNEYRKWYYSVGKKLNNLK